MQGMKNKFLFYLYSFRWSIVALSAIVAAVLLGGLAIFKTGLSELSINWSAASAISTLLAVLVALAFGLSESFERRAVRKKKSILAASSLMSTLTAVKQHIDWSLEELTNPDNLSKPAVEVISKVVGHLEAHKLISAEHLEDLYDEDARMAVALVASVSDLRNRSYILNMNFTLDDAEPWSNYLQRCGATPEMLGLGLDGLASNFSRAAGVAEKLRDSAVER